MLTPELIAGVHKAFDFGQSRKEIAAYFDLSYATTCRILRLRLPGSGLRPDATFKTLRHMESLLVNRVRKTDALLRIAAVVIRSMQPNARKRALLGIPFRARYGLSRQDVNRIVGVSSGAGCTKARHAASKTIENDMVRYFNQNQGHGFRKVFAAILEHQPYSLRQLQKVYNAAKLKLAERHVGLGKTSAPVRVRRLMPIQGAADLMWSMDYMTDVTTDGNRYWILNVIDDFNREAIITEVSVRRSTLMVVRCLQRIQESGRFPNAIRSDNGREFKGKAYLSWCRSVGTRPVFIRPGSPTENVLVERFNLTMRQEVLDRYLLTTLSEVQRMLEDWRVRYNLARPHDSLGGLSPLQFTALVKSDYGL